MKRTKFDLMVFMIPNFFKQMIKIPDIQREDTAWTMRQKQNLIDSLYNDFDIPKIYLRKKEDDGKWWLLDGQQRLTSVFGFLENQFALPDSNTLPATLHGKFYNDLSVENQERITRRVLDCIIVECTEEEEEDMFVRLNNGTPLSTAEKRNAIKGDFRVLVRNLTEHPFFARQLHNFGTKRFGLDVFCAQLAALTLLGPRHTDSRSLNQLYAQYKKMPQANQTQAKIEDILNQLAQIFEPGRRYLKKHFMISAYYLLLQSNENNTPTPRAPQSWLDFFDAIEQKRATNQAKIKKGQRFDAGMASFADLLSKSAGSKTAIEQRHHFLLNKIK